MNINLSTLIHDLYGGASFSDMKSDMENH